MGRHWRRQKHRPSVRRPRLAVVVAEHQRKLPLTRKKGRKRRRARRKRQHQ